MMSRSSLAIGSQADKGEAVDLYPVFKGTSPWVLYLGSPRIGVKPFAGIDWLLDEIGKICRQATVIKRGSPSA